jgi:hypothetical protein
VAQKRAENFFRSAQQKFEQQWDQRIFLSNILRHPEKLLKLMTSGFLQNITCLFNPLTSKT